MLSPYQVLPSAGASFPKGRKHIKVQESLLGASVLTLLLASNTGLRAYSTLTELKTVRGDKNFGSH